MVPTELARNQLPSVSRDIKWQLGQVPCCPKNPYLGDLVEPGGWGGGIKGCLPYLSETWGVSRWRAGQGPASQLLEEVQGPERGSWRGPNASEPGEFPEWVTGSWGALCSGWRKGSHEVVSRRLPSRTFYPCPPQLPEGRPPAPYSLPDITNCLVTFPIL